VHDTVDQEARSAGMRKRDEGRIIGGRRW